MITSSRFGTTKNGDAITRFTMTNKNGMSVDVLDYACVIQSIRVPDRYGKFRDVALGYDLISEYENGSCYYGSFIGRYANRIAGSSFDLEGQTYRLPPNEGKNHLHGVYTTQLFRGNGIAENTLMFMRFSPDGEEGFPGQVVLLITYSLSEDNKLTLDYQAMTDKTTVINLTNHTYFNLGGHDSGTILDTDLKLNASRYTEADSESLATGAILPVEGTPFDFRQGKKIGQDIHASHPMIQACQGYDLNYVLDEPSLEKPCAEAVCEDSGITLKMYTTQPGMQLYTGNSIPADRAASPNKGGVRYPQYAGFCLESQHFPCSPNIPEFPSTVLHPHEIYHEVTRYEFGVI